MNFSLDDVVVYGAAVATFLLTAIVLFRASRVEGKGFWAKLIAGFFVLALALTAQVMSFEVFNGESAVSVSSYLLLQTVHRGRLLETYALLAAVCIVGLAGFLGHLVLKSPKI